MGLGLVGRAHYIFENYYNFHVRPKSPPKPPAYRAKITDKLADVFNALTTLSELKCDVHLVAATFFTTIPLRACRYGFDVADQPQLLLSHWIRLHDALLQEYGPVCNVLQLLADWCATDQSRLAARTSRDNLTCALSEFQRSHRLGILQVSGVIGSEAEREYSDAAGICDAATGLIKWTICVCRRGPDGGAVAGQSDLQRSAGQHRHLADAHAAVVSPAGRLRGRDHTPHTSLHLYINI